MFMQYGPFVCIAVVLIILFILWYFWGGSNVEFVGLAPLDPNTCSAYTGSMYEWGNASEGANPEGINPEGAEVCEAFQEAEEVIDYTPVVPERFAGPPVCENPEEHVALPPRISTTKLVTQYQNRRPARGGGKMVSRGERICSEIMERIYGVPFENVRPSWLRNPETGERLELDCYNADLQLAVEYNGVQHYVWPNFTGQSKEAFLKQVQRDEVKVELCDRYQVYLIVVPYNVDHHKIPEYIVSHLPETIQARITEESLLSGISA